MTSNQEETRSTNPTEIEGLINRIEAGRLQEGDSDLLVRLLRLVLVMLRMIEGKNASIKRLKRLLFGKGPQEHSQREQQKAESSESSESGNQPQGQSNASGEGESGEQPDSPPREARARKPGHGRLGADCYKPSSTVTCEHEELQPGDNCPHQGCGGRLYDTSAPQILIQLEGRPIIGATRYEQQVLRCSGCQDRFAARLPEGVPPEKYTASADAAIAIMKYGTGLPWYRLARLQQMLDIPLPEATQFERCAQLAQTVHPVYRELERQAAAGEVFHFDDTGIKILACLKENKTLGDDERKGLHTTGVGVLARGSQIALYRSGRQHAGENLARLMRQRPEGLAPPIVMADAEAKNWSTSGFERIGAKCLQHGRRKFTDVETEFPIECQRVLDDLRSVYVIDAQTRAMSDQERLACHQARSKPIMDELRKWLEQQFTQRLVEPNSGLGQAFRYLLKHWSGLTRFLEVAGAPLDNNFAERILKRVVLHRKNAMFYKTQRGARVGDILMSLIETCALNQVNVFDYLVVLVREARHVRLNPAQWLPWNYQKCKSKAA